MSPHRHREHPQPVGQPFFTPGTWVLLGFMLVGFSFGLGRFLSGLGVVTNLSIHYPWGIWKAINVAVGVALASSGFTAAALIDIFGRKKYHNLLRPAILTAWLGYFMVAISLLFDLGRYWNIWQPILNWQGNSVLFEVAMCVVAYLIVLTFEISPTLLEGLKHRMHTSDGWDGKLLRRLERPVSALQSFVKLVLPIFIIAGFVLSCMHHSSLGTLMLIAPTKLSTLWFTPLLPLLFLISAMMVGLPMIIMESILAGKSFKYKPDMDTLGSLAAKVPWIIGIYGALKIGDLIVRWDQLNFLSSPELTLMLAIEIVAGLAVPFVMLLFRSVRHSPGRLLFAVLLLIGGVILNRLNTYLIGYKSSFTDSGYFPAIGEIAMTLALACTIIFFYRFFVSFFPVLPGQKSFAPEPEDEDRHYDERGSRFTPSTAWVVRGIGIAILLAFVFLYSFVHQRALSGQHLETPKFETIKIDTKETGKTGSLEHKTRPLQYRSLYIMANPLINSPIDYYEPVRFSHRTHDILVGGDCSNCHHRISEDENDRVGVRLDKMHAEIDVRIGGACATCHQDLNEKEFQKCSDCHIRSNEPSFPTRIGLRGAYHRQCIGCHQKQPATAYAPTDCKSCHHPLTPDHSKLVGSVNGLTPIQITARCLECHRQVGEDVLKSAHWNWQGLTPGISGHEHDIDTGLLQVIDNYTISSRPDLAPTHRFHIGYSPSPDGWQETLELPENVDCLICHDTTGTYKKDESLHGMPTPGIDLETVAHKVGRPSRSNCGQCHIYAGGGPNLKHGDMEPSLQKPTEQTDIHMGMAGMRCQDCHKTNKHRIAGMSFNAPVTEGRTACETCHGPTPHAISGILSRHLDDHVRAISCETCHIPHFAVETPTLISTDFSTAGKDLPVEKDDNGMPTYDKKRGSLTWGKNVVPTYRWFDGTRKLYVLGDEIGESDSGSVELNSPLGAKHIPEARIFPFKVHTANQPYDTDNNTLVPVKFKNEFWQNFDWKKAITEGTKAAGLEFSGQYGFIKTQMYTSIHHGTAPAKKALGCADCHQVKAVTCTRCHQNAKGMDQPSHTRKVYPDVKSRLDFKALGYKDDPAIIGGRFYINIGRGKPPR